MSDPKGTAVVTGATGGVGALVLAPSTLPDWPNGIRSSAEQSL
jgi:hypothetical protein